MSAPPAWLCRKLSSDVVSPSFLPAVDKTMRPLFATALRAPMPTSAPGRPLEHTSAQAATVVPAERPAAASQAGGSSDRRVERAGAEQIGRAVEALESAHQSLVEQARSDAVELALMMLKTLVGTTEGVSVDKLLQVAKEALVAAGPAKQVLLRVHPDEVAVLQAGAFSLLDDGAVELRGDANLNRGDVVVETEAGRIDGTRQARLDKLERSVRKSIGGAT